MGGGEKKMGRKERIYLDYAAATPLDSEVLQSMLPYFSECFGNANSQHYYGRKAAEALDSARETIASAIGARDSEIYFTSGGTESDNWAVKGIAYAHRDKGKHIIMSKIEHAAMLATGRQLEKEGIRDPEERVTGVQTCALPICPWWSRKMGAFMRFERERKNGAAH